MRKEEAIQQMLDRKVLRDGRGNPYWWDGVSFLCRKGHVLNLVDINKTSLESLSFDAEITPAIEDIDSLNAELKAKEIEIEELNKEIRGLHNAVTIAAQCVVDNCVWHKYPDCKPNSSGNYVVYFAKPYNELGYTVCYYHPSERFLAVVGSFDITDEVVAWMEVPEFLEED